MRKESASNATRAEATPARARREDAGVGLSVGTSIGIIGLVVAILVAAILMLTGQVRERLRIAALRVDGEVLAAAIKFKLEDNPKIDSAQDLVVRLLEASSFRDVFAFRVFDTEGKYVTGFPLAVRPEDLTESEAKLVSRGQILGKFEPQMDLRQQLNPPAPVVEEPKSLEAALSALEQTK